jgi:hypothetical protein
MTIVQREFLSTSGSRDLRELLRAIFVAELLRPSDTLWIWSGWISDIELLDNTAHSFTALQPDWPAAPIRLSSVLGGIATRGGKIRVILREVEHNDAFLELLTHVRLRVGAASIDWRSAPGQHAKGILGDGFCLDGSMNITHSGLTVNDESVRYHTDRAAIARRRLELEEQWSRRP